jgi:hypothetical protein
MKATCIFNRQLDLAEHQKRRATSEEAVYSLTIGKTYTILGMHIWENVLSFLVYDDVMVPSFVPAGLFQPEEFSIPSDWMFALRSGISASGRQQWTDPCSAVWGYEELVANPDHFAALVEGDQEAFSIFFSHLRRYEEEDEQAETD